MLSTVQLSNLFAPNSPHPNLNPTSSGDTLCAALSVSPSVELQGNSKNQRALEMECHGQLTHLQLLVVLICEVDQPGHVEEEFG